jgi:hypothetical protein
MMEVVETLLQLKVMKILVQQRNPANQTLLHQKNTAPLHHRLQKIMPTPLLLLLSFPQHNLRQQKSFQTLLHV